MAAFALRHVDHLRSAVIESPAITADDTFKTSFAPWAAKVAALVCHRSPSCSAANPDPAGTLAWLAQYLRAHPFDGTGYDAHRLRTPSPCVASLASCAALHRHSRRGSPRLATT